MSRDANKHLVLLIDEHRVVAAAPGDAKPVTIDLPGRWSDQKPEDLGELLKSSLGASRLAVGRVVVGVPVSWVLTQHLSVPSTDPAVTTGAVKLRVNRDYATDAGNLVADYTASRSDTGSDVLIGVTTRAKLRGLNEAMACAGLKPVAIYITTQAYVGNDKSDAIVIRVQPPMAELALVRHGKTMSLRSLCDTLIPNDPAGAARAITSSLASESDLSITSSDLVLASDSSTGLDPRVIVSHLNGLANRTPTIIDSPAIDMLRRCVGSDDLLDLLRCRASQETVGRWSPLQKTGAAVAAIVLIVLLAVGGLWLSREHRLSTLRDTAVQIQPEAEALGLIKQRLDTSAPWFDKRVDMLACMGVLTECIPPRSDLRLTEFRLNADHSGSLQGRAGSRSEMLTFLSAMQTSEQLDGVALRDSAESQNGHREVRFEIAYTFTSNRRAR